MPPRIIRYADQPDIPWANGLGSTRRLWADPAGERRISVAMLRGPAGFSVFPGIARVLAVLDPVQITLGLAGKAVRLGAGDSIGFSGDAAVELLAIDRPGRVLNIMADAARWAPGLSAAANPPPFAWAVLGDVHHFGTLLQSGDVAFSADPVPNALGVHFSPVHR